VVWNAFLLFFFYLPFSFLVFSLANYPGYLRGTVLLPLLTLLLYSVFGVPFLISTNVTFVSSVIVDVRSHTPTQKGGRARSNRAFGDNFQVLLSDARRTRRARF